MNPKSRENFIKIKEFLEDIYMYLNNNNIKQSQSQSTDEEEEEQRQRHEAKRKELIENCKHIRSIFELEFHPHDAIDSSSSYLDMNGANKNRIKCPISDENEIDTLREMYVEMNQRESRTSEISENPYNIYEVTRSLHEDYEKCPFTGLPAVHLKLMCTPIAGLLTRFERKLFFGQSKDFYAGILDKWILLYPSKSNDMKPSEYFYPKKLDILKKKENQFIIVTNNDKRYQFQAPNAEEYKEWIANITRIIEDIKNGKMRDSQIPQLLSRKLPSLPNAETMENYYSFSGAPQSINSNEERLYEEPCSSSSLKEEKEKEDLCEKPPELPRKTGKKIVENCNHGYDIPKSTKVLEEQKLQSLDESKIEEEKELPKTPPPELKTVDEIETPKAYDIPRMKVSEMTAILSGINLVSPEEKRKSSAIVKVKSSDVMISEDFVKNSKSPVRKWFKKRIMRVKREKDTIHEVEEEEESSTGAKGSKVNMIINKLEKTGQLKTLSKGYLKSRKSLKYENEDYELVCVKTSQ